MRGYQGGCFHRPASMFATRQSVCAPPGVGWCKISSINRTLGQRAGASRCRCQVSSISRALGQRPGASLCRSCKCPASRGATRHGDRTASGSGWPKTTFTSLTTRLALLGVGGFCLQCAASWGSTRHGDRTAPGGEWRKTTFTTLTTRQAALGVGEALRR